MKPLESSANTHSGSNAKTGLHGLVGHGWVPVVAASTSPMAMCSGRSAAFNGSRAAIAWRPGVDWIELSAFA